MNSSVFEALLKGKWTRECNWCVNGHVCTVCPNYPTWHWRSVSNAVYRPVGHCEIAFSGPNHGNVSICWFNVFHWLLGPSDDWHGHVGAVWHHWTCYTPTSDSFLGLLLHSSISHPPWSDLFSVRQHSCYLSINIGRPLECLASPVAALFFVFLASLKITSELGSWSSELPLLTTKMHTALFVIFGYPDLIALLSAQCSYRKLTQIAWKLIDFY